MAPYLLRDCRFFLGRYDLSGSLNRGRLEVGANLIDSTPFNVDSVRRTPGITKATLDIDGYYEAGDGMIDDALHGRVGGIEELLSVCPVDAVQGSTVYSFAALQAKLDRSGSYGELLVVNSQAQSSGPIVKGALMEIGAKTSTGNGTGRQLGAVPAAKRIYAIAHVLSGSGSLGLKLQSSATLGGTYTDRATFSNFTAPGAQRVSAEGPVADAYWRIAWTVSGGPFSAAVSAGIL